MMVDKLAQGYLGSISALPQLLVQKLTFLAYSKFAKQAEH
jgi:hypothetical protein